VDLLPANRALAAHTYRCTTCSGLSISSQWSWRKIVCLCHCCQSALKKAWQGWDGHTYSIAKLDEIQSNWERTNQPGRECPVPVEIHEYLRYFLIFLSLFFASLVDFRQNYSRSCDSSSLPESPGRRIASSRRLAMADERCQCLDKPLSQPFNAVRRYICFRCTSTPDLGWPPSTEPWCLADSAGTDCGSCRVRSKASNKTIPGRAVNDTNRFESPRQNLRLLGHCGVPAQIAPALRLNAPIRDFRNCSLMAFTSASDKPLGD